MKGVFKMTYMCFCVKLNCTITCCDDFISITSIDVNSTNRNQRAGNVHIFTVFPVDQILYSTILKYIDTDVMSPNFCPSIEHYASFCV